jgi:hypothetical protein
MKIRLSYTTNPDHVKYAPLPFDGVVIVPDDRNILDTETAEFEFDLIHRDHISTYVYHTEYKPKWLRFFLGEYRDYLVSRGCSCHSSYNNRNLCAVCHMVGAEDYHCIAVDMPRTRNYINIPQRTYFWKQVSGPKIHWFFYDIDRANYTDYNYGEIILQQFNVGNTKNANNIINTDGQYLVTGSLLLHRQDSDDGSTPPYEGFTIINGIEYPNSQIFY